MPPGTLTLTALVAVTLAQMEAALEGVTYVNTSENPSVLAARWNSQANDGAGANNLSNTPHQDHQRHPGERCAGRSLRTRAVPSRRTARPWTSRAAAC